MKSVSVSVRREYRTISLVTTPTFERSVSFESYQGKLGDSDRALPSMKMNFFLS
jgi:hypothetical protein